MEAFIFSELFDNKDFCNNYINMKLNNPSYRINEDDIFQLLELEKPKRINRPIKRVIHKKEVPLRLEPRRIPLQKSKPNPEIKFIIPTPKKEVGIPEVEGIKRNGLFCYLISAIQSLRYLDLIGYDKDQIEIINKIRLGDLDYIKNYFNFPNRISSARDALIRICNHCNIEITEHFEGCDYGSKNLVIINYYDNFLRKEKYDDIVSLNKSITIKDKTYKLKSATFYSPSAIHYITVIFKDDIIYVLNDNKKYEIDDVVISNKLDFYNDNYFCECAIYE